MSPAVLHLRSSAGMYGAEYMLLGLCCEQARRGVTPMVAAFAPSAQATPRVLDAASQCGIDAQALPCRGRLDLRCLQQLRRLLQAAVRRGVHVLHCHDYKSVVYGAVAVAGLPMARVATVHGWVGGDLRVGFYQWLEQRLLRGFDRICAVSGALREELAAAGVADSRLRRIDNGVDVLRFRPQPGKQDASGSRPLRIGTAARLSPEKNLPLLLEAVAQCAERGRRVELTVYGEGPERERLERQGAGLIAQGLLSLPGERADLEHWYPQLDAFVLPSLREGMPMTVLEALACGCPVLASDVGALAQVLDGLPGCRLLPAGELAAWVAALERMPPRAAPDPQLRRRVVERYSLAAMADRYESVYHEALAA